MNQPTCTIKTLAVCTALLANMMASSTALSAERERLYFGAGISNSDLQINQKNIIAANNLNPQSTFDNHDTGVEFILGVEVDEHLGFEIGYADLGSVALNDGTATRDYYTVDSLHVSALLGTAVTDNVDVFARLGISAWEIYDDQDDSVNIGDGLLYGLGTNINIYGMKDRVLRLEWKHHEFDDVTLTDSDTVTASVVFNF